MVLEMKKIRTFCEFFHVFFYNLSHLWIVRALYNCDAENTDELVFLKNELILVLEREDDSWLKGYVLHQPHRIGFFPECYTIKVEQLS